MLQEINIYQATAMSQLLKIEELTKTFTVSGGMFGAVAGAVHAVNRVSFNIEDGETLGLVGESGCGKSTLGRVLLRLIEPTSGRIFFNGKDVLALRGEELRQLRRDMQMIFQDPFASLNPRMTIEEVIGEAFTIHHIAGRKGRRENVKRLLDIVGLPKDAVYKYPHEFSGGQRQRIGIARAIALNPKFIVADEPLSALDVSIQAKIINLLKDIQREFNITYLFITHDLRVVRNMTDRVVVMYLGKVMEIADTKDLYLNYTHPYTEALLSAVPVPDPTIKKKRIVLSGDIPGSMKLPSGCVFHTRCIYAKDRCREEEPKLSLHRGGIYSACHYPIV